MITSEHYLAAMEEDYQMIAQIPPSPAVSTVLQRMIATVNERYPDLFVASGLQNGINQAFETAVRKLHWGLVEIQAKGVPAIKRFSRAAKVGELLGGIRLKRSQIDIIQCVQHSVEALAEARLGTGIGIPAGSPAVARAPADLPMLQHPAAPREVVFALEDLVGRKKKGGKPTRRHAAGDPSEEEGQRRIRQQERRQQELEQQEWEKALFYLPSYIQQGIVTEEEAGQFQALQEIEAREQRREIEQREAETRREEILPLEGRNQLERKIRNAIGEAVKYLQVFESLKKISPEYDKVLCFLIKYKEEIVSSDPCEDRTPALAALLKKRGLLDRMVDIMARKDPEIRLLAVRLPPYNLIMKRELEKIANLTIERPFIDDLRRLSIDDLAARLNSLVKTERVRPAADLRCFIHLVDHLIQPTRFRRKVVLLKVNQVLKDHQKALEDIFRAAGDPQAAALQAERFIRQRLERNLPEMTADEKREADQRSTAVIALLEQEFLGGEGDETETLDDLEEDEGAVRLTEEERRTGAQMGRVEMRVAGGWRLVPQKLMPDPDDPERFVIAVRDPASGDLVPQLRRGVKRFVEKTRDGSWRLDA